ncbi:MAG: TolC family protein [Bacteroidia bacterium]|nr:TolC family protein [Bacteroidia bacterium]
MPDRRSLYTLSFLFVLVLANAQNNLSLDQAIKTGLEKNFAVQIYKNQQQIAKEQNNLGNAGMSPTVSLNGNYNFASLNSHQEFNTGVQQDRTGAISKNLGASLNAVWTVFDGMKMFAVKKRLEQNEQLSALALKQQLETTVYTIIVNYYNIVKVNELLKAARQNLAICQERKKIAQLKFDIGSDSKVDVLLSQSDENRANSDIVHLELQLLNAKATLNTLINNKADEDFNANDSIVINYEPTLEELKKSARQNNPSLLLSRQSELMLEQSVREARSANLPFVQLNGAYNFTRNQSQAGIIFLNRQAGLNAGISAGWLLFNGNKNNKLVKERSLLALNQKLLTEQTTQQVDSWVYINYQAFLLNKKIAQLEAQNLADSKELMEVSLERYRIGKTNLLETIEAQKNLQDARLRHINALYSIKISETELLKSNGVLVK